jgi:hypothetical protein
MSGRTFLDVDPRTLRLPPSRLDGADPSKLARQIARYGQSTQGMPALECFQDKNGLVMVWNGVTLATRIAKLIPGASVRAEIIGIMKKDFSHLPTVEDRLP